jgi:plasmid stabilization system protein ParE
MNPSEGGRTESGKINRWQQGIQKLGETPRMGRQELEQTARELIAEGKGILAADEVASNRT